MDLGHARDTSKYHGKQVYQIMLRSCLSLSKVCPGQNPKYAHTDAHVHTPNKQKWRLSRAHSKRARQKIVEI